MFDHVSAPAPKSLHISREMSYFYENEFQIRTAFVLDAILLASALKS